MAVDPLELWKAEKRKEIEAQNQADSWRDPLSAGLSSLAAAFQGKDSIGAAMGAMERGQKVAQSKLDAFDKGKANAIQDYTVGQQVVKDRRDADLYDPNSARSQAFRKTLAATVPNIVKQYGEDFNNISAADEDRIFKPIQLKEQMDARKQVAALAAQERADKRQEKKDLKDLELAVPGFKRTGEVLPKTEEAQKFRKATAVADQLTTKLKRLRTLVKDKGSFEYGGNVGQEMETLATEIQLLGKSPELYELGVLTGPDLSLLQKITADPTSMSSLFTRDNTRLKQIDTQLGSAKGKIDAIAKSLGYRRDGETGENPPPPPKYSAGDTVKIKGKSYRVAEDGDTLEPI